MKELLTYIAQSLVDQPDQVTVTERESGGETVYELHVAPGDMGKVIGRQGKMPGRSARSCARWHRSRVSTSMWIS